MCLQYRLVALAFLLVHSLIGADGMMHDICATNTLAMFLIWGMYAGNTPLSATLLLTARNSSKGVEIRLYDQETNEAQHLSGYEQKKLDSRYLSPECGDRFRRCSELTVVPATTTAPLAVSGVEQATFVAILPLDRALGILKFTVGHLSGGIVHFIDLTSRNCSPSAVIQIEASYYVVCLNSELGTGTLLKLNLDTENIAKSRIPELDYPHLQQLRNVTNFLHVDLPLNTGHYIYFAIGYRLLYIRPFDLIVGEVDIGLQNDKNRCFAKELGYTVDWEMIVYCNDNRAMYVDIIRVQCSQHITKLVTACGSHRRLEVYDSQTLCQCGVLNTDTRVLVNVTLRDDLISFKATGDLPIFENISRSHPFSFTPNISYSFCHIESDLAFVFGLSNGSVFSFSFTTGKTSILARNSCNSTTNTYTRGECYKARLYNPSGVVLVYDYVDSSFVVTNLSCLEDPVVARIVVYPLPPLDELVRGPGGSCPSHPSPSLSASSTVSPSASPVLTTPTTKTTVHPNKNVSSTITYPTSTPTTGAIDQPFILLLVVPVFIIGIITPGVLLLDFCRRRRKARSTAVNSQQLIPKNDGTNRNSTNPTRGIQLRQLPQSPNSFLPRDSSPSSDSSSSSPNSKEYSAESDPATTDPTKSTSVEPASATPYPMTSSFVGGAMISGNEASGEVDGYLPVVSSDHNTEDSSHSSELLFTSTPNTVSGDDDDQPKPKPPGAMADPGFQSQPLPSSETVTQLQTTNAESSQLDDRQQSLLDRCLWSLVWPQPSYSGGATVSNNPGRMDLAFPNSLASPGHSSQSEPPSPSPSHRLSQYVSDPSPVVPPTPASNTPGNTAPVIGQHLLLRPGFVQHPPNPHPQPQNPGQHNPGHQQPPNPHLQPQNPGQPQQGQNTIVDPETGQKGKNNS